MILPTDFQFTDNPAVNEFAAARAELMFGKGWKVRDNLVLSNPSSSVVQIQDMDGRGWVLRVDTARVLPHQFAITCLKNNKWEDPAPDIAAHCCFYESGKQARVCHYSSDHKINPPDGTPSEVNYKKGGKLAYCWYANSAGTFADGHATKEEIDRRIAVAKQASIGRLCDGSQEIVALKASMSKCHSTAIGASPSLPRLH